jgi:hypothetical protein
MATDLSRLPFQGYFKAGAAIFQSQGQGGSGLWIAPVCDLVHAPQ